MRAMVVLPTPRVPAQEIGGRRAILGRGPGEHGLDHVLPGNLGESLGAVTRRERQVLHEELPPLRRGRTLLF